MVVGQLLVAPLPQRLLQPPGQVRLNGSLIRGLLRVGQHVVQRECVVATIVGQFPTPAQDHRVGFRQASDDVAERQSLVGRRSSRGQDVDALEVRMARQSHQTEDRGNQVDMLEGVIDHSGRNTARCVDHAGHVDRGFHRFTGMGDAAAFVKRFTVFTGHDQNGVFQAPQSAGVQRPVVRLAGRTRGLR